MLMLVKQWIKSVIENESCSLVSLHYIFCSDQYLHKVNVEHLNHDYLTDIITFPFQEPPNVEADIYISIDRVKENAQNFDQEFERELHRVIIHGVLHLMRLW